jgi:hypothetical protein
VPHRFPSLAASLALLAACERGFLPLGGHFEVGRDPMVVFVGGDAPAGGDLYALRADGGGAIPITFSVVGEMRPSLSPDGSQVAFLRGGTLADSLPATVWVLNLVNGAERRVPLPLEAGRPERVGWTDGGATLVVRTASGIYRAPAPPAEGEAVPVTGRARPAAESSLAVLLGNPAFARVVPCEDPADLCVEGDEGAPALLAKDARDAARWGDDSVAYLAGGRLVVRPVGPGRARVLDWNAVPARPRQLTVFPGASGRR